MRAFIMLFIMMAFAVSALAKEPRNPCNPYQLGNPEQYTDAAVALINQGLLRFYPELSSVSDRDDTVLVRYPYLSDEKPCDPPQEFLDKLYCAHVKFLPVSQASSVSWARGYVSVSNIFDIHNNTVTMTINADCHWIVRRRNGYCINYFYDARGFPMEQAAQAVLKLRNGKWEIVDWKLLLVF